MRDERIQLAPWQAAAIYSPFTHTAMYGGVATGKTFTGSQYSIKNLRKYPGLSGFIGANTYDQLSQATLRELLYWLDFHRINYVIDCMPPPEWGARKEFKTYKNIISVKLGSKVSHIFTRVLARGDRLRGIEFSWYWIDETRDTPENTHNIILSRQRESDYISGLVTSTTNGEDWGHERFIRGARRGDPLYGSMHVPTSASLAQGIINKAYFNQLLKSYSPLLAEQELNAMHVNVAGGRAYYAASQANKLIIAPWGDTYPNRNRPLLIGCDHNFSPAPHVWMVGQVGPALYGKNGEWWPECVHWFGEFSGIELSTRSMMKRVMAQYPDFFYEIYGDASGMHGTTSNSGDTDVVQMRDELMEADAMFDIHTERSNPRVKDRVETMNAMFKNAMGEIRQTYSPANCPLFDGDCKAVGWDKATGKLSNGGSVQRTHATDGAGYVIFKKFPMGRGMAVAGSMASPLISEARGF